MVKTTWSYGLVQTKEGLLLCEVYFKGEELHGCCPVHWKELRTKGARKLMLGDITDQVMSGKYKFKDADFLKEKKQKEKETKK